MLFHTNFDFNEKKKTTLVENCAHYPIDPMMIVINCSLCTAVNVCPFSLLFKILG